MSLARKFTEHPAAVGETYGQHFRAAMGVSLELFGTALVCAVHALFPWLFETAGSTRIAALYERVAKRRPDADGGQERIRSSG